MESLTVLAIFFTSLVFSLCAVPLVIRLAHWGALCDLPDDKRRVHTVPIPRLGGVAIVAGFYFTVAFWKIPINMKAIYLCSLALFAIGLIDDIKNISAKIRLFIQIFMACTVVYVSDLSLQYISISQNYYFNLPIIIGFFISVFIIVGAINSINMIDGLDGLAGGAVLIATCLLSYIHYITTKDVTLLIVFSLPIIGALLGFLKYNTHPSTIFMGDSGSNWLGFMLGVFILLILNHARVENYDQLLTLVPTAKIAVGDIGLIPTISVILALSIPIFDTAHVIFLRLKSRKSPMAADNSHFHHALIRVGFTHGQSVVMVYFFMIIFGVMGVLPIAFPAYNLWWSPWVGLLICITCISLSHKFSSGFIANLSAYKVMLSGHDQFGKSVGSVIKFWEHINRYTIYFILLGTPFFIGKPPTSLGYAACVMGALLLLSFFLKKNFNFLEALLIACSATVLLVANNSNPILVELSGVQFNIQNIYNSLFIWLLVSTVLFFFVTIKRNVLVITPTDFLLILLPLLLLLLPEEIKSEFKLNIIALRSLVLFAALRTLGKRHALFFYKIHVICLVALVWIALTSLGGLKIIY